MRTIELVAYFFLKSRDCDPFLFEQALEFFLSWLKDNQFLKLKRGNSRYLHFSLQRTRWKLCRRQARGGSLRQPISGLRTDEWWEASLSTSNHHFSTNTRLGFAAWLRAPRVLCHKINSRRHFEQGKIISYVAVSLSLLICTSISFVDFIYA